MKELVSKKQIETMSDGIVTINLEKEKNEYFKFGIRREYDYYVSATNIENKEWYQTLISDYKIYANEKSAITYYNKLKSKYNGWTKLYYDQQIEISKKIEEKYGK